MGFFRDEEIASLRISNMILHVVSDEDFRPEPARVVEHAEFFIERIRDTDVAPVFAFHDQSQTKAQLERIASGTDDFEVGCQTLSREFSRFHHGSSRNGAFFIFELCTDDPNVRIYSLIKYDYQEAIEQQQRAEGGNLLRLIVQAFVADKRAIQKAALVRVERGVADVAVAARDRMRPAPEIGDYFARYLDVLRSRTDEQLNQKLLEVLNGTLKEIRDILPNRDLPNALREAKTALHNRQRVSEEAIGEALLAAAGNPDDEGVIARIQSALRRKIRSAKLEGLEFPPDRRLLRSPAIRRVRTTEGVLIFYPDGLTGATVNRRLTDRGGEIITITTRQVTEDDIVRREPRSAS